jgi:hypothetical protein
MLLVRRFQELLFITVEIANANKGGVREREKEREGDTKAILRLVVSCSRSNSKAVLAASISSNLESWKECSKNVVVNEEQVVLVEIAQDEG